MGAKMLHAAVIKGAQVQVVRHQHEHPGLDQHIHGCSRCLHTHKQTHAPSSPAYCDRPPHVIIPYTHKPPPLHAPSSEKTTPPPQLSVSAAGLLNWLWSAAFGGALLCALPNWSQWRLSRRTLAPVVLCSRAQRSIILYSGAVSPLCHSVCLLQLCVLFYGTKEMHKASVCVSVWGCVCVCVCIRDVGHEILSPFRIKMLRIS